MIKTSEWGPFSSEREAVEKWADYFDRPIRYSGQEMNVGVREIKAGEFRLTNTFVQMENQADSSLILNEGKIVAAIHGHPPGMNGELFSEVNPQVSTGSVQQASDVMVQNYLINPERCAQNCGAYLLKPSGGIGVARGTNFGREVPIKLMGGVVGLGREGYAFGQVVRHQLDVAIGASAGNATAYNYRHKQPGD
jgi:hypothetical protein